MLTSSRELLLIEDSEADRVLISAMLAERDAGAWRVESHATLADGLALLRQSELPQRFAAILVDLSLPDSQGLDTVATVLDVAKSLPIVVLTGNDDERLAIRALNEGAQDYLVKGKADGQSLVRSMRYAIERNRSRRLERDNTALEGEIRARKLAQEQLERVAAQLEASNRELQQFASVASHDLQEPLRKIVVFGDRLRTKFSSELGEQGRDYVDRMMNASGRMQTLINDLLEFSRIVTRARPFVAVEVAKVIREVLGDLREVEVPGVPRYAGPDREQGRGHRRRSHAGHPCRPHAGAAGVPEPARQRRQQQRHRQQLLRAPGPSGRC